MTAPRLVAFKVKFGVDTSSFTLIFSETVNSTSFDPTTVTFTDAIVVPGNTFTLTGTAVANEAFNIIDVYFSSTDSTALMETPICQSIESCFISFTHFMVLDYDGNPVIPVALDTALQVR